MYITLYKSTISKPTVYAYDSIMQNTDIETIPQWYKTTIEIENAVEFDKLAGKQKHEIQTLELSLNKAYYILQPFKENFEQQYYEFKIPKRSGGLRTINAPLPEFMVALSKVKDIFEQELKCLAHNNAYAYVKNRSTHTALEQHQKNQSKWYLKLDLKDFFPSCSPEFIYKQLKQLYPFYYFNDSTSNKLKEIVKICCLNDGLPQGTPMSPLLTNLIMVPYDYAITNYLKRGTGEHYVYTRYADDILISSKSKFNWQNLQDTLQEMLHPFEIKKSKTRFGSIAGSNWNLGLMLNKDNNITLGYKKKKVLNAMLNNFLYDFSNNVPWSKEDTYTLQGQLGYLKHIEPEYYQRMLNKYQDKYDVNYANAIKKTLNPNL